MITKNEIFSYTVITAPLTRTPIVKHEGIAGNHPLRGVNDDEIGPRFPAVSDAYDGELQEIIVKCGKELGLQVR
jgi:purine-nucleoside phosphorylase